MTNHKNKIEKIGFGGASISGEGGGYGFGEISENEAISLVQFALDSGIRLFDTAPIYGFGESERRLGKALKGQREKAFLVSKSGVSWHENKRVNMTNDPKETQKMLEASLKRLNTDWIDLYMVHWPDQNVDIRRPVEVLSKAKEQGKIKMIGLCNTHVEDLKLAKEIAPIEHVQVQFNFFERPSTELLKYLEDEKISLMAWGLYDKGILSGSVKKDRKYDESDCRSWAPWWKKSDKDRKIAFVEEVLTPKLKELGFGLHEFALSVLLNGNVDTILCGGKNQKQWQETLSGLDKLLPPDLHEQVEMEWKKYTK